MKTFQSNLIRIATVAALSLATSAFAQSSYPAKPVTKLTLSGAALAEPIRSFMVCHLESVATATKNGLRNKVATGS